MSEFKFACPVCGQHITADSNAAGTELECPTCFRKIVVPQAPSSADPKFILSAAEASKPRPQTTIVPSATPASASRSPVPVGLVLFLVIVCVAGVTLFLVRGKTHETAQEDDGTNAPETAATDGAAPAPPAAPVTNSIGWSLELTNVDFPNHVASGQLWGREFICERASLQGGTLTLRRGRSGAPDPGLTIAFYATQPDQLQKKTLTVTTNNTGSPPITLRWKQGQQQMSTMFNEGYALKIEFGELTPGGLSGKIYLCLPDQMKSAIAGTFNAEVRRPAATRPRQTQQRPQQPQQQQPKRPN